MIANRRPCLSETWPYAVPARHATRLAVDMTTAHAEAPSTSACKSCGMIGLTKPTENGSSSVISVAKACTDGIWGYGGAKGEVLFPGCVSKQNTAYTHSHYVTIQSHQARQKASSHVPQGPTEALDTGCVHDDSGPSRLTSPWSTSCGRCSSSSSSRRPLHPPRAHRSAVAGRGWRSCWSNPCSLWSFRSARSTHPPRA